MTHATGHLPARVERASTQSPWPIPLELVLGPPPLAIRGVLRDGNGRAAIARARSMHAPRARSSAHRSKPAEWP